MTDKEKEKTEKDFMEWLKKDHKLLDKPSKQDIQNKCERAYFEGKRIGLKEGRKEAEKDDIRFCHAFCMRADKRALLEQIEKMKCCQNCTHSILNECDNLVCELNWFNLRIDYPCVNYSKWELKE